MTGIVAALGGPVAAGVAPTTLDPETGLISGGEVVLFWVLAVLMVAAAMGLIFARKAVHAAVAMVFVMICLAFMYTTQEAPFLGVAQVVVYTGAIMMLFVFVLMLIGVDTADNLTETIKGQRWISLVAGVGLTAILAGVIITATFPPALGLEEANAQSNPVGVAYLIFGDNVFALEAVGALLITAALGALMLAHRQRLSKKITQKDRSIARVKAGTQSPLPAPGVYARHNAVDVPAIDPYGHPIESSVSRVLRVRGQQRSISEFDLSTPYGAEDQAFTVVDDLPDQPGDTPVSEPTEKKDEEDQ